MEREKPYPEELLADGASDADDGDRGAVRLLGRARGEGQEPSRGGSAPAAARASRWPHRRGGAGGGGGEGRGEHFERLSAEKKERKTDRSRDSSLSFLLSRWKQRAERDTQIEREREREFLWLLAAR